MIKKEVYKFGIYEKNTGELVFLSNNFAAAWHKLDELTDNLKNIKYDFVDLYELQKVIKEKYLNSLGIYKPIKNEMFSDMVEYQSQMNEYLYYLNLYDKNMI